MGNTHIWPWIYFTLDYYQHVADVQHETQSHGMVPHTPIQTQVVAEWPKHEKDEFAVFDQNSQTSKP